MYYPPPDELDTPEQPRFLDNTDGVTLEEGDDSELQADDTAVEAQSVDTSAAATTPTNGAVPGAADEEDDDDEEEDEVGDDGTPHGMPGGMMPPMLVVVPACPNLDALYGLREIGREALCWQLSSAKPGNGVEQIRDHSTETYWQSDGTSQPHWIQVHFARRVAISHVCLYLDYNLDESYTPRRLSVQVGMTNHDLVPAITPANALVEFHEPVGWCIVPLRAAPDPLDDNGEDSDDEEDEDDDEEDMMRKHTKHVVKAHLVQISILSQHQNGRDTHVRQVQLYGPRTNSAAALRKVHAQSIRESADITTSSSRKKIKQNNAGHSSQLLLQRGRHWDEEFSTVAMSQYSTIR